MVPGRLHASTRSQAQPHPQLRIFPPSGHRGPIRLLAPCELGAPPGFLQPIVLPGRAQPMAERAQLLVRTLRARLVNSEHWNRGEAGTSGLSPSDATGIDTDQPECVGKNRNRSDETTSIDDAAGKSKSPD